MLKYRLILGPILILALIVVFWLDNWLDHVALTGFWRTLFRDRDHLPSGFALLALSAILVPIAAWELTRIFHANHIMASSWLTCAAAELGLLLHFCIPSDVSSVTAVAVVCTGLVLTFVISLAYYSRHENVEGVVAAAGGTMFSMIYLGLMLGFILALRRWNSAWLVLAIILITKSCDIGAYFTGRAIGRHKLIPWLSPGKTWEGLVGGLVTSTIVASLLAWWGRSIGAITVRPDLVYHFDIHPGIAAFAGLLFGIVGQMGDLTASLFKRDAGFKDSSAVLPGFGGVLDVLDSPLLVAPLAFWLLTDHVR